MIQLSARRIAETIILVWFSRQNRRLRPQLAMEGSALLSAPFVVALKF